MNNDTPIYNSRITKIYIEYLQKAYPDIHIGTVLHHAGMTEGETADQAHWFSQNQVDRFQEAVVRETQNPNIAREAGRYAFASQGLGVARHYILGLLKPSSFYLLISKVYSVFSRGVTLSAKKVGKNRVEIIAAPNPGVEEKPFQCQNRMGMFESATRFFIPRYANIEHPECFHNGGKCCRYIATWKESRSYIWNKLMNYSYLAGFILSAASFAFLNLTHALMVTLISALISFYLRFKHESVQLNELKNTAETQGNLAKELLDEMTIRHNNALLIQEIGQAASSILDTDRLIEAVIKSMEMHMDFDRGLVLMANESRTKLIFKAGFGYNKEKEDLLRNTEFNLTNPDSKGAFVLAFKNKEPLLINSISDLETRLTVKSLNFAREMGAESIICVPIFYEKESLGILTVDNIKSKRPLTQSDLNVMMGVGAQMAISIINALSFKKLEESGKKYRDLVENANSIIMRLDINGNITFFNKFARHFFNSDEETILGKYYEQALFKTPEQRPQNFQWLLSLFQREPEKQAISEDEVVLHNGRKVWITWTNKPIFDEWGNITEILLIGNDITELKRSEIDKKALEERLQRAEKMEAIGTLAGGVAHDLNNILSGIVSYPELLLLDIPLDSKLRKPITTIQKAGERASAIVQDLLTLARRGVIARTVLNLNNIISEYRKSPEHENLKAHHPKVKIHTDLDKCLFNIQGSGIHLTKTVMNLVLNAAEAIGEAGEITIKTENRHVDRNLNAYEQVRQGDYATLSISDTGIGISPKDLNRIFEPFYTKKKMGRSGTGLGMAVVWGTIKDHNAYIDVKSTQGLGTTFTLFFPITRQAEDAPDVAFSVDKYRGKGEKILIVDDVEEQREIASEMLSKLGYFATAVPSGEDAVDYIKTHSVDLIILDMIMENGMDGLDTYKHILKIVPKQKAIITSGFSETVRVKETQKLGATRYLRKPYILEQLGKATRDELNQSR